jgi:hypothetical protein
MWSVDSNANFAGHSMMFALVKRKVFFDVQVKMPSIRAHIN